MTKQAKFWKLLLLILRTLFGRMEQIMKLVRFEQNLKRIVERIVCPGQIHKKNLRFGDFVHISTQNSDYFIHVLQNDFYLVSGGWFDQKKLSPAKIKIRGCTWGGNVININIVAACGLHLEFDNGLLTSVIQKVIVYRGYGQN
jgi:hypothetical protein